MKSPVALLEAFLKDLRTLSLHTKGLDRDFRTIEDRVKHEGDSFLSVALPSIADALTRGLDEGWFSTPRHFSKCRGKAIPKFLSGMLSEVFNAQTGALLDHPCAECIQNVYMMTRMFKKLSVSPSVQRKLDLEALGKYGECEFHVTRSRQKRDPAMMKFVHSVAAIGFQGLELFDPSEILGRHGPGAVCERLKPNEKWARVASAIFTDDRFDTLGYTERMVSASLFNEQPFSDDPGNTARVISVPKTRKSVRLITVEPVLNQFIQGGINKYLRAFLKQSVLRDALKLSDQTPNQRLALEGSRTGEWATIDLTSASDCLDKKLVEAIFGRYPAFNELLDACRSPRASFGKTKFVLEKFAGMGNATTFPIQSMVYAIIAIAAILDQSCQKPTIGNVERIARRSIQVFGDDIVVRTRYYDSVLHWLTAFGFMPNESKCFAGGKFRESCGVDAYDGVEITPVYVRHWPTQPKRKDQTAICSLVATSNLFWERGLYNAATVVQELVESLIGRLPLVSKQSSALGWHTRQDVRTLSRWNRRLHRFEYRGWTVRPKKEDDKLDGVPALLKYFHLAEESASVSQIHEIPEDHLASSVRKRNCSLSRAWCSV